MSAPSDPVSANLRPTRLSGSLAVAVLFGALVSLGGGSTTAFAVEALGLALLAVGVTVRRDRSRAAGDALVVVALAVVLGALAFVWIDTRDLLVTAQAVPGMVGVLVLALGVIPARGRGSRRLVKVGSGLVLLSVFVTAVVVKPPLQTLLVGTVAIVLAWDLGENAIGLGAQLGRRAETYRVELAHGLGSAAVGAAAVVAGKTVAGVGTPGFPLGVFAVLLIGLVLLAGALHE
ncbi:hypothetical protein [Halosimplex sp. TS25]|uniref:DUF7519 family protein n=1 Tax=Halosimplex rarum TaxID=3396619 RepID=UPI0039E87390